MHRTGPRLTRIKGRGQARASIKTDTSLFRPSPPPPFVDGLFKGGPRAAFFELFLHPLRPLLRLVLARLEPFALDLWRREIADWLPPDLPVRSLRKQTYFGGLYQKVTITRG